MRAGEVDDDAARGRLERRRPLVVEAHEDDVGAARERLLVRHERGQPAAVAGEARVEREAAAGERVRAERDELELGMREHAVERLLTG